MSRCPWQRRLLIAAAVLVTLGLVFYTAVKVWSFLDRRQATDQTIVDQSRKNQLFIECAITFALANDPPKCADVKAVLASDGIPLTPNPAAQVDPTKNPAVAIILCTINASAGLPPPEGVTCPAPKGT